MAAWSTWRCLAHLKSRFTSLILFSSLDLAHINGFLLGIDALPTFFEARSDGDTRGGEGLSEIRLGLGHVSVHKPLRGGTSEHGSIRSKALLHICKLDKPEEPTYGSIFFDWGNTGATPCRLNNSFLLGI